MITVVEANSRAQERWVGIAIGYCCSKDPEVHCFSDFSSVIFQHMEYRRVGLPELSLTKLIFTHWDLTFGELPGNEIYVNVPQNTRDNTVALELFAYCAYLRQMSCCSLRLMHRYSGCNLLL